jgi:hypothetical protein
MRDVILACRPLVVSNVTLRGIGKWSMEVASVRVVIHQLVSFVRYVHLYWRIVSCARR